MTEAEKWPGVAERIAAGIRDGTWPVGSRLPRASVLAEQMGVAERTSRKAVAHLAGLGYLEVVRSVGVRVAAVPPAELPRGPVRPDPLVVLAAEVADLRARVERLERRPDGGSGR